MHHKESQKNGFKQPGFFLLQQIPAQIKCPLRCWFGKSVMLGYYEVEIFLPLVNMPFPLESGENVLTKNTSSLPLSLTFSGLLPI